MLHRIPRVMSLFINIAVSVYMILLLAVMPFYFSKGYGRIGTDKYEFFREVTIYAGVIILPLVLIYWGIKWAEGRKTPGLCRKEIRSGNHCYVFGFGHGRSICETTGGRIWRRILWKVV